MKASKNLLVLSFFCLATLLLSNSLPAQTHPSQLSGRWKFSGNYPSGQVSESWKIEANQYGMQIYAWRHTDYSRKGWVQLSLSNLSYDGYRLGFTVQNNLAGSMTSETFRLQFATSSRMSGSSSVQDNFLKDAGIEYTNSLLSVPMDIPAMSTYQGSIRLVRE